MASKTMGRTACPCCPHDAAHVKLKTDKAPGQTAFPYVHCRDCGIQMHTRTQEQAEHLLRKTRPEKLDEPAAAPAAEPDTREGGEGGMPAAPVQDVTPAPAVRQAPGFFGGMFQ